MRIYADGVYDLFHHGHVEFLRQARALGDHLLVGVLSDDDAATYKPRPVLSAVERERVVAGCRWVDEILPSPPLCVTRDWIDRHSIDLVVHGDDMDTNGLARFYAVPMELGIFRTVPHTREISTTDILRRIEGVRH